MSSMAAFHPSERNEETSFTTGLHKDQGLEVRWLIHQLGAKDIAYSSQSYLLNYAIIIASEAREHVALELKLTSCPSYHHMPHF